MADEHDALDHLDVVRRHRDVRVVQAPPGAQVERVLVGRGATNGTLPRVPTIPRASIDAFANGSWLPSA